MKNLKIQIEINPELYLKDPDSSDLGRKILSQSINLMNEIGFELFTFKKLGLLIKSPESSIYRYFESKHTLLLYLTSWYWTWTEFQLVFVTSNILSPSEKLARSIEILTKPVLEDNAVSHINEVKLCEIIFSESFKVYHTKDVDEENKKGCFKAYKSVVQRVSEIILEIKSDYKYPHMLISTVIEGAHQQKFFAEHLPSLTDITKEKNTIHQFYTDLVFKTLDSNL